MIRPSFDVGLVVPLKEEFKYICEDANVLDTIPYEGTFYYQLSLGLGLPRALACVVGDIGPLPTLQATMRLLVYADIKLLLLLGVAGSLDADVRIGDVVIADDINEYMARAKAVPSSQGFEMCHSGRHTRLDFRMREALTHFDLSGSPALERWRSQNSEDYALIAFPEKTTLCNPVPQIHIGPIASGDIVGSASAFVAALKRIDRKFIAIDMEAAGIAKAATERLTPVPFLVIRGISDSGDEQKGIRDGQGAGVWRRYSTRNALRLLKALLTWDGFPWDISATDPVDSANAARDRLVQTVARALGPCIGATWLLGVAVGVHGHAPVMRLNGEVEAIEITRLRVEDKSVARVIKSVQDLGTSLRSNRISTHDIIQRLTLLAARLPYRRESEGISAMLRDFDRVVSTILLPGSGDTAQSEPAISAADHLLGEERFEAVLEVLTNFDPRDPRIRTRLADAYYGLSRYSEVVALLESHESARLSRAELENLIMCLGRLGEFAKGACRLADYRGSFANAALAHVFCQQVLAQFPSLGDS
jgi:nucleoside phosphorylase